MTNSKRREFNKAIMWASPTIVPATLPAHAQTSDFTITSSGFEVNTLGCGESVPPVFAFELTNTSTNNITVNELSTVGYTHRNPALPITIPAGGSERFEVSPNESSVECRGSFSIDYNTTT